MVYNFFIYAYKIATHFAAKFSVKANQRIEGLTKNELVLEKIKQEVQPLVWFHAASLGEFEQARPVLEQFKQEHPDHQILLTFFSPSGYEVRKNYALANYIAYLPFDLPNDMEEFISAAKPAVVFWVKYEYWRNCLRILAEKQVPVFLFSAIFREEQPFFKCYGRSFTETLTYFRHLFVQDAASADLLKTININNVTVAGDTRFDRVADTLKNVREIEIIERFKANRPLLVVGSAWEEDVACAHYLLNPPLRREEVKERLTVIIAPHELHEEQIERWKKTCNGIRYSEVTPETSVENYSVLIIDNIGLLASVYQYADAAFIGGAFGKGLHNILEAATFGMPVFFGNKNYKKFKEATDLIALNGAFPVADAADFKRQFAKVSTRKAEISKIVKKYVAENTGATEAVLRKTTRLISMD